MMQRVNATFRITGWDDQPYDEIEDGPKLTRTKVTKVFEGDVEGASSLEYLMVQRPAGSAAFVGVERVVGRLGGRSGSFVLQHTGTFADGVARDSYEVVSGSGTGDLRGLRGGGSYDLAHADRHPFVLDYDFE